jgi:hypothetical protein
MVHDGGHSTSLQRNLRIGRLAPLVLVVWVLLDLGLRLLPGHWFTGNPIMVALRRPPRHASFAPNFSLTSLRPFGDAVREANLKPTEIRRPERFSTDALGFRLNPFVELDGAADVLVLRGFSYVYGGGLSDEHTLPATLTRLTGVGVYNGGRWHLDEIENLQDLEWLLQRLPVRPRTAIVVYLEHEDPPFYVPTGGNRAVALAERVHPRLVDPAAQIHAIYRGARQYERRFARWWDFSPLEVLTTRVQRSISNDRILPNVYRNGSHELRLPDGRGMVFREFETRPVRFPRDAHAAAQTADYFEWWRDELDARGIEAAVLILPTRYTVYAPFLETGPLRRQSADAVRYLNSLGEELASRGIRHVDATPVFHERAFDELRRGQLSFYREDNHWTPRGVEHVARELVRQVPEAFVTAVSAEGASADADPLGRAAFAVAIDARAPQERGYER